VSGVSGAGGAGGGRILDPAELERLLDATPGARDGLVLANGLFDLLHVGHVRYLASARAEGRSLVVALNSDRSARALKGPSRPVVPLVERLEMVAALRCVDWVTWFDEENVENLLRRLRPAAHAKGTDYTVESVPEREVARSLGIRTVIVGDPKRHASSDMIERLRSGEEAPRGGAR
jgi:rfaE bifunctional protein nucleotidyltransferase chain/domain